MCERGVREKELGSCERSLDCHCRDVPSYLQHKDIIEVPEEEEGRRRRRRRRRRGGGRGGGRGGEEEKEVKSRKKRRRGGGGEEVKSTSCWRKWSV